MNGIVYVDLKPDYAKLYNLPVKLPILITDFQKLDLKKPLPLDLIVRGLKFEFEHTKSDYYKSYLIYFLYEQFKYYFNNNDLKNAEETLKYVSSINDDYRANFYKGLFYAASLQPKDAEVEFRKAISKNSSFPYARFELAKLLYKNEEFEEAIEELKKIILIDKTFSLAYNLLSDIYIYQKDYDDALKTIIQGLSIDDTFQPFYEKLTAIYNDAGYFADTISFYESSSSKIRSHKALYNIAFAYMNEGKLKISINILESLRGENKDYIYELLGRCYRLSGDYEKAIEVLERGYNLTLSPVLGISYANALRAVLHLDKAESIYNEVAESNPEALFLSYYMYENYFNASSKDVLMKISDFLSSIERNEKTQEYFNEFEYIINKPSVNLDSYLKKIDYFLDYYFNVIDPENFNLIYKKEDLAYNLWMPIFFKDDPMFERMLFENASNFNDKILLLIGGYIIKYIIREGEIDDYILSYLDLKISSYYVKLNEVLYKVQKNLLQHKCDFVKSDNFEGLIYNLMHSFLFSDSPKDVRGSSFLGEYEKFLQVLLSFKTKESSFLDSTEAKNNFLKSFKDMIASI